MNSRNWNNYRTSEEGKNAIGVFDYFQPLALPYIADGIFAFSEERLHGLIPPERNGNKYRFLDGRLEDVGLEIENEQDIDQFLAFIDSIDFLGNDRDKLSWLPVLSVYLYINYSWFKPILFSDRYDYFLQQCNNLGIELPEMTRSRSYRDYFIYYHQLCGALNKFQSENQLTDAELCACLYDYAATLGDDDTMPAELPQPTNIWLTGANEYDVKKIEKNGLNETVWACNEHTRRGDIIVIYAVTPNSCLYAIGRAKTDGFFDPFDYYHCRAVFTDGKLLPRIPFKELKAHPYISQIPVFRQNLQGIKGRELSARDYKELVALIREHGYTDELPELLQAADYDMPEVNVEKDVEEKILIPFLSLLGYTDKDYTRQLSQQFGRDEKGIPDFTFFPQEQIRHNYVAPFIIEAKYDMRGLTTTQNDKEFRQAFSYARDMHAAYYALCDKEKFVLYKYATIPRKDNPIFEANWANIYTNDEVFMRLKKLIGRSEIERIKVS